MASMTAVELDEGKHIRKTRVDSDVNSTVPGVVIELELEYR